MLKNFSLKFVCLVFAFSCFIVANPSIEGVEIRGVIDDSENVCLSLINEHATCKGDYAFTDHIYSNYKYSNLNDEFIRIREYQITKWKQKAVVVVHKIRDLQGNNHQSLFKEECDSIEEAERFISADFYKKFSFSRRGWEYCLGSMHIYIEEIDGLGSSIEVIGPSREEILNLFNRLKVIKVITDSVPEWYDKMISVQTSQQFKKGATAKN
jgi:adenylate cyclase class IV